MFSPNLRISLLMVHLCIPLLTYNLHSTDYSYTPNTLYSTYFTYSSKAGQFSLVAAVKNYILPCLVKYMLMYFSWCLILCYIFDVSRTTILLVWLNSIILKMIFVLVFVLGDLLRLWCKIYPP